MQHDLMIQRQVLYACIERVTTRQLCPANLTVRGHRTDAISPSL